MAQVKITLIKSTIGCKPDQRATVKALGLNKLQSSTIKEDNDAIKGMIFKIKHLVKVENA
jgi:large subunit ribosomal protein L30